jgi:hypothetical protein
MILHILSSAAGLRESPCEVALGDFAVSRKEPQLNPYSLRTTTENM